MSIAELSLAETKAAAALNRAAVDYAALCSDHGTDHIWHDQWRTKFVDARRTWREALTELRTACDELLDPVPDGMTERNIAFLREQLEATQPDIDRIQREGHFS